MISGVNPALIKICELDQKYRNHAACMGSYLHNIVYVLAYVTCMPGAFLIVKVPVQLINPSPINPSWHSQKKLPSVLKHIADSWQGCGFCWHSLTSALIGDKFKVNA
jgi:hypothetical protein